MTNQRAIILLSQMYLPNFDDEEKDALTKAIEALTEQEPRVLTLEEFKAYRLGVSPKERLPLWTEWKKDKRKNRYTRFGVDTDAYGTEWRCWSAKPTDEQREAVKWE